MEYTEERSHKAMQQETYKKSEEVYLSSLAALGL